MKSQGTLAAWLLLIATLVSCDTVPTVQQIYWKNGTTSVQRSADFTPCEVEALRQVPAAMAVGQSPTYTLPTYSTPAYTSCNGAAYGYGYGYNYQSNCTTTGGSVSGGQTMGGQIYSYDANLGLRQRVGAQCLAQKGWQLVSLPTCTSDQTKQGVLSATVTPLPPADSVLCVTADSGFVMK